MLLRLLLALLLAGFAVPAGAMPCHEAGMPAHRGMAMPAAPEPQKVAGVHACLGCIPPGDWLRAPFTGPLIARAKPALSAWLVLEFGSGVPPALPPPRSA